MTTPDLLRELLDARALITRLEWSATVQGQGYGPHGSGGNGPLIPACPACRGIHPARGRSEFIAKALGHRPGCPIAQIVCGGADNGAP